MRTRALALLFVAAALTAGCSTKENTATAPTTATTTAPTTSNSPSTSTAPAGPTLDDAFDAIAAANLDPGTRRDNTGNQCPDLGCTRWVTTDVVSISQWPTAEKAADFVTRSSSPTVKQVAPTVVVRFVPPGGSTPAYDQAAYEAALANLG